MVLMFVLGRISAHHRGCRRLVGLWVAMGCSAVPTGTNTGDGGSNAGESTSGPTPTSGTVMSTSSDEGIVGSSESSGSGFLDTGQDIGQTPECDNWAQDCPPGQKCSAYANDGGGSWNALKCVPVMENPAQPGEPCFAVDSGVSGVDNCDLGAMCWDVDAEGQGTCIALCTGTPDAPVCAPEMTCAILNDVLNLCFDLCDPVLQDCPPHFKCAPVSSGFLCIVEANLLNKLHEPCFFDDCAAGLTCVEPNAAEECDQRQTGCCEPFCDVNAANTCPGVGQVCAPWFEPGEGVEGTEHVGVCRVPP